MSPRRTAWGAYNTIAETIRARLADGTYPPGTRLPSEDEFAAEFGVARSTVRRALECLADRRAIHSVHGIGRFAGPRGAPGTVTHGYSLIADDLRARLARGEWEPGEAFPSEADLLHVYAASRTTIRRALAVLEASGALAVAPGRGRYVPRT